MWTVFDLGLVFEIEALKWRQPGKYSIDMCRRCNIENQVDKINHSVHSLNKRKTAKNKQIVCFFWFFVVRFFQTSGTWFIKIQKKNHRLATPIIQFTFFFVLFFKWQDFLRALNKHKRIRSLFWFDSKKQLNKPALYIYIYKLNRKFPFNLILFSLSISQV
jgi:hypothetical protein